MIPEKLRQVIEHEGVVAIATGGAEGVHLVNSWNSYIQIAGEDKILIPAGGMHQTEKNLAANNQVLVTVGSREVPGFNGPGTGFLVTGNGEIVHEGDSFARVKDRFPWARGALVIDISSVTQTL